MKNIIKRIKNKHRNFLYRKFAAAIRETSLARHPDLDLSVHILTCHKDLEYALWCLSTFSHFAQASPFITVHDDGSLTDQDCSLIRARFANCEVVLRPNADRLAREKLAEFPLCRKMRSDSSFHLSLKLFDPWFHAKTEILMIIDSDVIFFSKPVDLLECAASNTACFNSDYQDALGVDKSDLEEWWGHRVLSKFNSGLMIVPYGVHDLELIESFFGQFLSCDTEFHWLEQTAFALLMSKCKAQRLSSHYQISHQPITSQTISHHFVKDGSRSRLLGLALPKLHREGFPGRFAGAWKCWA